MSAWKKPSRSAWRRKRLDHLAAERGQIVTGGGERGMVVERRAVDPFEREHVARGAVPIDRRDVEVGVLAGVLRHLGQRRRFEPEIHLDRHRARQRGDDFDQAAAAALRASAPRPCAPRRRKNSSSERSRRSTPGRSTFTADRPCAPSGVCDFGLVHLRDRRRRDRRAEAGERSRSTAGRTPQRPRLPLRPAGTAPSCPAGFRGRGRSRRRPRRAAWRGTVRA